MQIQDSDKNISREALLDAAEYLFTMKGYAAVSTREVAERASVNLGAIQYHFGSKATLFAETIRRLVHRTRGTRRIDDCACNSMPTNIEEASTQIVLFVYHFLSFVLRPEGPATCRMMFREILSETIESKELSEVLISTAVSEFMEPVDQKLRRNVALIRPDLNADEVDLYVQSILGQCSFYITHSPLLKRLRGKDFSQSPHFESVAAHIARFSLQALGRSSEDIESAFQRANVDIALFETRRKQEISALSVDVRAIEGTV